MGKRGEGVSRFSVESFCRNNFCLAVPKSLQVNPSVMCFGKLPLVHNFLDKKWGRVSRDSVEIFFNQSAEKFHRRTLLCCVLERFR